MAENIERDNLPHAMVEPKKGTRISIVWIIPILAAVVAIGIAIQRVMSEGPTITILFKVAEGIEAGKTFVKFKDVNIGQVTTVKLSRDHSKVEVTAKIDKSAADLMVEDAKFWVVEPRITLSGVSGLGTLLSGNYIGFEVGKSDKQQRQFTGLEVGPIISRSQLGRRFVLKAENLGSLGIGSPIYYRRLQAGQVIGYDLAGDGKGIDIKIFINEPYEKYVNPETRFWNASGVDVTIGASGFELRTQSLVALLAGGLAFDTPAFASKTEPAAANASFKLYRDQDIAMRQPEANAARYVLYFPESLRGLTVGAPVTLLGLTAGEVVDVGLDVDPAASKIRGRVEILFYPHRLAARLGAKEAAIGKALENNLQQRHALIQRMVEQRGLRAQLRSGSLITGQLYVALDFFPNPPKAKIDWSRDPVEFPVMSSEVADLEQKVNGILAKLDNLPYEAIGADVTKALVSLDQTLKSVDKAVNRIDVDLTPGLKTTIEDLRRTIASADGVLKSTDTTLVGKDAPGQQELRDALQEIARAARSLRILTDFLEQHPEALLRGKTEEKP
jgi:paraquat-inducible protein B